MKMRLAMFFLLGVCAVARAFAADEARLRNVLTQEAGARVLRVSSEFGSGWVAENLVPNAQQLDALGMPLDDLVWSSASQVPFPHQLHFDLGQARWLTSLRFNNALAEEPDHPGISARHVEVWVGDSEPKLRKVASVELERNRRDQVVAIEPVQARLMTLVITSNWGHPWYTELGASAVWDDGRRPASMKSELQSGRPLPLYGVYFDFASAKLRPESDAQLNALAEVIRAETSVRYILEGHTDSVGAPERNLDLSRARAQAVVGALIQRGIAASRLQAEGFGETQPVADNAHAEGRAKNRRVSIRQLP